MCIGVVCTVYDNEKIYRYESGADSWLAMELVEEREHYFGKVPLIEHENNEEQQGDFEALIPLMDAYNKLQSDRVNDKEQFVDAFLFLRGPEVDAEQAADLKKERILMGSDEHSDAKYLSKIMSESDVEVLRDCLKNDIHRISMVPDLSDESFGNNLSGVAIEYKLLGFEQNILNKERSIKKSLRYRFELYNYFLNIKNSMTIIPVSEVDIIFTRNLPANNLEKAQMISHLKGTVSDETLLGQLDFISDPKEEAKIVIEQNTQRQAAITKKLQDMAEGGGY